MTMIRKLDYRVGQTYDTSAGVAVGGGRGADLKRRKKGISIIWLFVGVLILLVLMAMIPKFLGMGAGLYMKRTLGIGASPAAPVTNAPAVVRPQSRQNNSPGENIDGQTKLGPSVLSLAATNLLRVTGHVFDGKQFVVFMSDGSKRKMTREFAVADDGRVRLDGVVYEVARVAPGPPVPVVVQAAPVLARDYVPGVVQEREPTVSVTVIGSRSDYQSQRSMQPDTIRKF